MSRLVHNYSVDYIGLVEMEEDPDHQEPTGGSPDAASGYGPTPWEALDHALNALRGVGWDLRTIDVDGITLLVDGPFEAPPPKLHRVDVEVDGPARLTAREEGDAQVFAITIPAVGQPMGQEGETLWREIGTLVEERCADATQGAGDRWLNAIHLNEIISGPYGDERVIAVTDDGPAAAILCMDIRHGDIDPTIDPQVRCVDSGRLAPSLRAVFERFTVLLPEPGQLE